MDRQKIHTITAAIEDIQPALTSISEINDKWETVEGLVESGDITNKKLISTVQENLRNDQGSSLRSLIDLSDNIPYEELVYLESELDERVRQQIEKIHDLKDASTAEIDRLNTERNLLISISPSLETVLEPVLAEEIERLRNEDIENAEFELDILDLEREELDHLFIKAGQAWPIPKLADARHLPAEGETVTIETFPDEHASLIKQASESVQHKFESRLNDASAYTALLMQEIPGHVWTAEELGYEVYSDNDDAERNASRIQSLFSNYRRGKNDKIGEIFTEKGLILQRGKRTCYDAATGKKVPNSQKAVWRAVDKVTADADQVITTITSDRQSKWTTAEWQEVRKLRMRLETIPSGNNDGENLVNIDIPVETARKSAPHSTETDDSAEAKSWEDTLRTEIHAAIEIFKEKNLLVPEVSWKMLQRHLDSNIAATETTRERAFKHKIISHAERNPDALIDVRKALLVYVQNSFQHILGVNKKRRLAIEIVDEIVDGYFRSQTD